MKMRTREVAALGELRPNVLDDDVDGDGVGPAVVDVEVRVLQQEGLRVRRGREEEGRGYLHAGGDEVVVGGLDEAAVLLEDAGEAPPPTLRVPAEAAGEAGVCICTGEGR